MIRSIAMLQSSQLHTALRNGLFFITICTRKRFPLFAEDSSPTLLSVEGSIARKCWLKIPHHFPNVVLSDFVIMPDHMHGILAFTGKPAIFTQKFGKPISGSLETIIRNYKGAVTRNINLLPNYEDYKVWQRGFYEHRIRDEEELRIKRQYIQNNPDKWIKEYQDK